MSALFGADRFPGLADANVAANPSAITFSCVQTHVTDTEQQGRMRRTAPLVIASAAFIAAGGVIHVREWLDVYRHVPADVPGAAVVRIGFPLNAAASLIVALALLFCAWRRSRFTPHVVVAAVLFQAGALAALIVTRTGSLLGWSEPGWTIAAEQTRAVEVGALVALAAVSVITAQRRMRREGSPSAARSAALTEQV